MKCVQQTGVTEWAADDQTVDCSIPRSLDCHHSRLSKSARNTSLSIMPRTTSNIHQKHQPSVQLQQIKTDKKQERPHYVLF